MSNQDWIKILNKDQKKAVLHMNNRSILVLAGAGSGKTRVLTYRLAYLIEQGVAPEKIMAVTFTNKAADEMKERISKIVDKSKVNKVIVGTFHSFCARMLRKYGHHIGIPKSFTIYDTSDSAAIIKEILVQFSVAADKKTIRIFRSKISDFKNRGMGPEQARAEEAKHGRLFCNVYEVYEDTLKKYSALDFDDLILKTLRLLQSSKEFLHYCHNQFEHILVDEYQDTNQPQAEILLMMQGANNIFVVGDDAQSIYGFRGADVENILGFGNYFPDITVFKLDVNYRSTQMILAASNALISNNAQKYEKPLKAVHEVGEPIKQYTASNEEDEASFVAQEIKLLTGSLGYKYSDIAILYRTNMQTRLFEDALLKSGIPVEIIGSISFYDRKEIKDLIAFLRLIHNPGDNVAYRRLFKLYPGLGEKTLSIIQEQSTMLGINLLTSGFNTDNLTKGRQKALNLLNSHLEYFIAYEYITVDKLLKEIIDVSDFYELCGKNFEKEDFVEDLLNIASKYYSLEAFLENFSLSSSQDQITQQNSVKMMTVHASKGLEYPVVFVVGLEESIFPHQRAGEDVEEERRLAYVAMTRAQKDLYLTHSIKRYNKYNLTSRFIQEIPSQIRINL